MPEPSTTILARLISMVRIIDAQPGISVAELAQFFGRPEKRIRADIDLLDNAGVGDLLREERLRLTMTSTLSRASSPCVHH